MIDRKKVINIQGVTQKPVTRVSITDNCVVFSNCVLAILPETLAIKHLLMSLDVIFIYVENKDARAARQTVFALCFMELWWAVLL